jgi:hypothetical protein
LAPAPLKHGAQVCGIVLSTRPRGNAISVWVRHDHHDDPQYAHDYEVFYK